MLQYLQHEERCQVIQVSFSWSFAAWLYFYKKTIIEPPIKMHPSIIQRVHCIKISVFSHIRPPILIQSWGALFCPNADNTQFLRAIRNGREYNRELYEALNGQNRAKMLKYTSKVNDSKSYR